MLKFGQIIDLESLDKMTVSKAVKDLMAKAKAVEIKNEKSLRRKRKALTKMKEDSLTVGWE